MAGYSVFSIEDFLAAEGRRTDRSALGQIPFTELLEFVRNALDREWELSDDLLKSRRLELEKGAIMGIEKDAETLKDSIRAILTAENLLAEPFPPYYPNLTEALFAELYGLSGIAPWAFDWTDEYKESSSAKLIGDRLYCLIDGRSVLQPQRIPAQRRAQLIHALLLATPKERVETGFHEVYLNNGIRVTIYSGEKSKKDQDIIVFRKYVMKNLSFEALAAKGTFPFEAIPLFKAMCRIGFNVVFAGQVRSGKTTFLQTWQACEDPSLEGVAVATDPETHWEQILPDAPLMQLVADGKDLLQIEKSLKRSDADYVILEEMRDAISYSLFLGITNLGTTRSKGTIHDNSALNIPYKMASAIASELGGDQQAMIAQLFSNIHFVFELCQLPENKAQKRLTGIWEYRYDPREDRVYAIPLCRYHMDRDSWDWAPSVGADKLEFAGAYPNDRQVLAETLEQLSKEHPLADAEPIAPAYYKGGRQ